MKFLNRQDVALRLIPLLEKYKDDASVLLAVPRGGVPIAYFIAQQLHLPIELLMTKKIGHPHNKEYAIGAVSPEDVLLDERHHNIPETYIEQEVTRIREDLKERYDRFTGGRKPIDLRNKTIIIIDDGIATGYTLLAAIQMMRKKHPAKIVVAVPVAPQEAVRKFKSESDEFICLHAARDFRGVGQFYDDFSEVSDEEVIRMMKEAETFTKNIRP